MSRNLSKQIVSFLTYQIVGWVFYLVILSISTFFHFLLEHRLGVIEDWLFEFGWQLIILAKVLSFVTLISFYTIKFDVGNPLVQFFYEGDRPILTKVLKLVFFLLTTVILFGSFELSGKENLLKILASYTSTVIFFSLDLLFLIITHLVWKIDEDEKFLSILIQSTIFVVASAISFFENNSETYIFLAHFFILMQISIGQLRTSWTNPLLYLMLIVAPITSVIGVDPVWKGNFSLFQPYFGQNYIYLYTILVIGFSYVSLERRLRKQLISKE